jgi:bacteriorhodopsin
MLAEILEIIMIVSFGASWPLNVMKSLKAKTTKGKSLPFLCLILFGYVAGIISKLVSPSFKWYVLFFYCLNFVMVALDLVVYVRNYRLDKKAEEEAK